jgi:excisionase family DNA binding protein
MTQEIGGGGTPPGGSAPQLHSVRDAAKILGSVSERFVWQLVHDGVLTRVRIGSRTLVRDDELAAYIEANTER